MIENFKGIDGYGNYQISNCGRVKSLQRKVAKWNGTKTVPESILKPNNIKGYLSVCLFENGKRKAHRISRLVAAAFIPNPANKPEVNHIDGNKANNHVSNLEWATSSENQNHAYSNGLQKAKTGENSHNSKLTELDIAKIKNLHGKVSQSELAKIYGVSQSAISRAISGKRWNHLQK